MENQHTQQQETAASQAKKGNTGKRLPKTSLGLGIIASAFTLICLLMFGCASTSRPSSPSEIITQIEFQNKLQAALEEFHQKVDAAAKEAE